MLLQDKAFPTVCVDLPDGENVSVPWGACCLSCRSACRKGIPFRDVDEYIVPECKSDSVFKSTIHKICDIDSGLAEPEVFELEHSVDTNEGRKDEVVANFDGFTAEQFMSMNGDDLHPAAVGLPSKVIEHPVTGEDVEVFWKEAVPAFSWKVGTKSSTKMKTNRMPERVYASQPQATFDFWKSNLNGVNEGMDMPLSQASVDKLLVMHKKRAVRVPGHRGSGAQVTLPNSSASVGARTGQSPPPSGSRASPPLVTKNIPTHPSVQSATTKVGTPRHLPRVLTPTELKRLTLAGPKRSSREQQTPPAKVIRSDAGTHALGQRNLSI